MVLWVNMLHEHSVCDGHWRCQPPEACALNSPTHHDYLLQVAAASFPFLARLGTGGFASGYKSGLVPDDGKYAVATVGGRRVAETSKVMHCPSCGRVLIPCCCWGQHAWSSQDQGDLLHSSLVWRHRLDCSANSLSSWAPCSFKGEG